LSFLGNEPLSVSRPSADKSSFEEGVFGLDRDKAIHVLLTTDDLSQYDRERAMSKWPRRKDLLRRLQDHLEKAEARILDRPGAPNEILHLVLIQGMAPGVVISRGSYPRLSCPVLTMSASDLEVLALVEGEDQLALWKYARAHERVREQRPVRRISTQLDEFHHYRRNGYNYYFTDRGRTEPMLIPMGGAGALRREVQQRCAFRGVPYVKPNYIIEVTCLYDGSIPIYAPWRGGRLAERVEILVEALPTDVWIVGTETLPEPRYRLLYFHFADMIAYWLWRLAPGLSPHLEALAEHRYQVQVHLDLLPDERWFGSGQGFASGPAVECSIDASANLCLQFRPEITHLLEGPDNKGEREVMRQVLRSLRDLHIELVGKGAGLTDAGVEELLDRHVPLGRAKKLLYMSDHRSIEHQGQGLPRLRKVQSADVSDVLDELGDHLSSKLNLPVGRIPDNRRNEILGDAVDFLFGELENLISTLSPEELLEWLVGHNESILHKQSEHGLLIPARIACFGSESEMVNLSRKEMPELNRAALASRFLIEYVAARPPRGIRPISLSVYDRLMAISSEIVNLGMISDAVNFGIADLKLSMLRSGRLGMRDEPYEEARDQFMGVYLAGEIYRSTVSFDRRWRQPESEDKPEDADEVDSAVKVEFGLTLTDLLEFLIEAMNVGLTSEGEPKTMPRDEFLDRVEERLGWDRSRTEDAFKIFSLRWRDDFLSPPLPFRRAEVYPWRFNRELSYIRRPLLVRPAGDKDEVVWGVRHCFKAFDYLIGLCVGGRLKAKTPEMKRLISEGQDQDAKEFNDRVAEFYEAKSGWVVRRRVKKISRQRIERASRQDLGDIDVLAADAKKRVLWAVEVKNLAFARNPAELANELENIFRTRGKKRAAVDKHLERVAWLRDNLVLTLEWLGLLPSEAKKRWKVEPLLVVDHELQSPYFVRSLVPVVSFRDLEDWHERKRGKGP
jgi:hypothetical protein